MRRTLLAVRSAGASALHVVDAAEIGRWVDHFTNANVEIVSTDGRPIQAPRVRMVVEPSEGDES